MTVDRWDPFRDVMTFREAMDRWLQHGISGTGQLLSNMRSEAMPIDLIERDDAFVLRAAVPGVVPEDVEVTMQGERITLRAEMRAEQERAGDIWLVREQRSGTVQRSITLPSAVSTENAEARIENGVLTLRLPKAHGATAHRINVVTGGSSSESSTPPGSTAGANAAHGASDHTAEGDLVTEQSEESFSASDPPSWTPEKS